MVRITSTATPITIHVPSPFAGTIDLGFSARYGVQPSFEPLRDVPLWIEGPAGPMRRLLLRLRMLHDLVAGRSYAWTDPVQLADEVTIVNFHGRPDGSFGDYVANLLRPVIFPFLSDCAQVADIRLEERIEFAVEAEGWPLARFVLQRGAITPTNGTDELGAA